MDTDLTADGAEVPPARIPGAPAAVGEVVADRWKVVEVRRGGQAWVLIVDDIEHGVRRAVKTPLRDGAVADDAELAMLLGIEPHPHVISALDVTEIDGRRSIVLEYVPLTLGEVLRQRRTAPPLLLDQPLPDAVALVLQQACAGLVHLSAVGEVAHLDLKPSNVLVGADGHAKIADFGLAQQVRVRDGRYPAARGGTWAYAAPEVLRQEPCDTRADLFSFGILLYEACTGELPYPFRLEGMSLDAQRRRLLDYYDSPGPGLRTKELYYCSPPTQYPVALSHENISLLVSNCLGVLQEKRNASFAELEPLLTIALRQQPLRTASAALGDEVRQRRVLALSRALMRLGRLVEAISKLNQLLAAPLPDGLFAEARDTAVEALTQAGRHEDAAALDAWR